MFFIVVRFSDDKISRLFDLARIVAQPDFARPSHITLRGPYSRKENFTSSLIGRDVGKLAIRKPLSYFSEHQNTVYLAIDIIGIADFWYKPDYPDGEPHLTVYDGPDRKFAWLIFSILKRYRWRLSLNSSPMQLLESKQTLEAEILTQYDSIRSTFMLFSRDVPTALELRSMPELDRLILLDRICQKIHELAK
jgi:hypothetical protein